MKLKCVIFKYKWFNSIVNRGVWFNKFGVVNVNSGQRYNKFEHSILALHTDQVSFLPYLQIKDSRITWLSTIKITPYGQIVSGEKLPLQQDFCINVAEAAEQQNNAILFIDPNNRKYENLPDDIDGSDESDDQCSDDTSDDEYE